MPHLNDLAAAIGAYATADAELAGIALDSRTVRQGDLFVAVPGLHADGEIFIDEARRRGAAAIMARNADSALPSLVVEDPRAALPLIASAFYGAPAQHLRLIGITGTLGKTSTASFIHAALRAAGVEIGIIGSLGIFIGDRIFDSGMTTPDAPALHAAFREMVDAKLGTAVMEVTSHALLLRRTDGLMFRLGVLTNLVPDEHLEFHPTPEHYLETKLRFLEHLAPGAPLIVNSDDALAERHTRSTPSRVTVSSLGSSRGSESADVTAESMRSGVEGSEFVLKIHKPLPGLDAQIPAQEIGICTPLLGREQLFDIALGATAALIAGAPADAIVRAAASMRPLRRRMELLQAWPMLLDDTTGNPRSLYGVFDFVETLAITGRIRVVFGLRGMRGTAINISLMEALARVVQQTGADLTLTASSDAADERNRVQPDECRSALEALARLGTPFVFEPELGAAISHALRDIAPDDFVLLLGAQGMDQAAELARSSLRKRNIASRAVPPEAAAQAVMPLRRDG